jgi:hypothetical protein
MTKSKMTDERAVEVFKYGRITVSVSDREYTEAIDYVLARPELQDERLMWAATQ